MPAKQATRGGYRGIESDPCPQCGESYQQFYEAGIPQVQVPGDVDVCVLREVRVDYKAGIYIHEPLPGGGGDGNE